MRTPQTVTSQAQTARSGFTLLELLAVMTIMAIMMGLAVMAFKDMGRGTGMRGALMEFKSALSQARQLAITQRTRTGILYGRYEGHKAFYVITNTQGEVMGHTNYFPDGVTFLSEVAGETNNFTHAIQFKIDGACDTKVGKWNGLSSYREIVILEDTVDGFIATARVYKTTGRIRVYSGQL